MSAVFDRYGRMALILCGAAVLSVAGGMLVTNSTEQGQVYAADAQEEQEEETLPSGISAVLEGLTSTPAPGTQIERIGTSAENVLVGQRVSTIDHTDYKMDVNESMEIQVDHLEAQTRALSESAKMMSDSDYEVLLRIVESEAGEDDVKARILVANVIMNRIARDDFPDNVTDVVFQYVNGVPQFSPTYDGRIYTVTVTDESREAVRRALEGEDYSEGALFFIQKEAAEEVGIDWFESELKRLFKYGVHEFYTYPDEVDMETAENNGVETVDIETARAETEQVAEQS